MIHTSEYIFLLGIHITYWISEVFKHNLLLDIYKAWFIIHGKYAHPPDFYPPWVNVHMTGGNEKVMQNRYIAPSEDVDLFASQELIWVVVAPPHKMVRHSRHSANVKRH